jgi:F-type H+-transporting ATPase subunit epsilon
MATRNTLHVEVVTAERELYNGEADMVIAPGSEGELGILPQHAALLTTLKPGAMRIRLGGAEEPLFVSGGFL